MKNLYRSPSALENSIIQKGVCRKRDDMFVGGLYFGILSMCLAILFSIIGGAMGIFTKEYYWITTIILVEISVCSTIGGLRSRKELLLYKSLDYSVCKGKIISKKRRNCWSDSICVEFDGGITRKYSVFGHEFRTGDSVLISEANTELAPWALSRVTRYL